MKFERDNASLLILMATDLKWRDTLQVYIEALNLDLKNTSRRIETYEVEFAKRIEEIQV